MRIIDYIINRGKNENAGEDLVKFFGKENDKDKQAEALNIILQDSGFKLDKLIYKLAFELASEDLKADLLMLDPDMSGYLDQEEELAKLLQGKTELDRGTKEKIADLIVKAAYNEFAEEWQLWHYFASMPISEVAKKWAEYNKVDYKHYKLEKPDKKEPTETDILTELMDKQARERGTNIGELLRETVLKWLDKGLIEDLAPLFSSESRETVNGETKLKQKDIFKEWIKIKTKANKIINDLIEQGEIKAKDREIIFRKPKKDEKGKLFFDKDNPYRKTERIITGESLYNFKGEHTFVKDFKEQVNRLLPFGHLIRTLKQAPFLKGHRTLLAFLELFKRLSKTFETDLTYKIIDWVKELEEDLGELDFNLARLADQLEADLYEKDGFSYYIDLKPYAPFIEDAKPDMESIKIYNEKMAGILGDYF